MGTLSVFLDVPFAEGDDVPLDIFKKDPSPNKVCLGHSGRCAGHWPGSAVSRRYLNGF